MVRARRDRIHRQVELILPAEVETRLRQRIVPHTGFGVALGQVGCVGRDLVGNHAGLHIVPVREAEVFFRRDVAQHRRAVPADHRGANR